MKLFHIFTTVLFSSSLFLAQELLAQDSSPKDLYRLNFQQETAAIYEHFIRNSTSFSLHGSDQHQDSHSISHTQSSNATNSEKNAPTPEIQKEMINTTATAITQCHIKALALYPPELQSIAFQAVVNGDNSDQARQKFITAIDKEKQTSTAQEQRLREIEKQFLQQANHCISQALSGTPLLTHQQ